jgi:SSS family solute:Na+ symporter
MVICFVVICLLFSLAIGLIATTRVHNTKDFAVAGCHLLLPIMMATVFATWFGAETVRGISATFVKEGLRGVVADLCGSSLFLILVDCFFASKLYRMNLLRNFQKGTLSTVTHGRVHVREANRLR